MVYGVIDSQEGIDIGEGWVGPSANLYAAVDDAAEAVGGAVMVAQALLIHTPGIAPQPLIAGLHTQDHAQTGGPLHLGGGNQLRVLDPVAHGGDVVCLRSGLQGLEHRLDGHIADGVIADLQVVPTALHGELGQGVPGQIDPAALVGGIGIVEGQGGRPAAHGAVDIQRAADVLQALLQSALTLGSLIKNLYGQRIAVLIAHQKIAGAQRGLLRLGTPALHGGHGGHAVGQGYF